jgi:Tol biopolymer transport system component
VLAVSPVHANDWIDDSPVAVPGTSSLLLMSDRTGKLEPCIVDTADKEPARCRDVGALAAVDPSPSPDGKWFVFHVPAQGIYVAALDDKVTGDPSPRRIVEPRPGLRQGPAVFSPDGKDVYFTVFDAAGASHLEVVPAAGGTSRRFLEDGARRLSFSPKGDLGAFVFGPKGNASVELLDVATGHHRPLAPDVPRANFSRVTFSASGARAALVRGGNELLEIDVRSRKLVARFDGGNEQVSGAAFRGEDLFASRLLWSGNLWMADVAR